MSLVSTAPKAIGVVVPASDEESSIEACIDSIIEAGSYCEGYSLWIVVVADACSDATAEVAKRSLGALGEVVDCSARSAGTARAIGTAAALRHFAGLDPASLWLANTDADSRVPRDWLRIHLGLAEGGAAAVAGIVRFGDLAPDDVVATLYRDTYRLNDDGTHPHVHGANIAVRADAYLDVGGWCNHRLAEDHCLWGRLRAKGWPLCSPVSSVVITSARLIGRAPGGFADTLRARVGEGSESV